jgi:hypothetical protein
VRKVSYTIFVIPLQSNCCQTIVFESASIGLLEQHVL